MKTTGEKGVIDPAKARAAQAEQAANDWTNEIADKVMEILSKEGVLVSELPTIMVALTSKVNKKWNNAQIATIIKL
jgi:hypothetical protein